MQISNHIANLPLAEVVSALEDWNIQMMWANFEEQTTGHTMGDFGRGGLRVQRMLLARLRELTDMEPRVLDSVQHELMENDDILLNKTLNLQQQ